MSVILLYHGVYNSKLNGIENYSGKHMHKNVFEKQIRWLKKNCELVNLDQFYFRIKSSAANKKLVSVTFDDSYKNIFTNALPILNKYKVPATFFVNTNFINKPKLYWTDYLEALINSSKKKYFSLNNFSFFKKKFDISTTKQKISTAIFIKNKLKKLRKIDRDKIIDSLKKELHIISSSLILSKNYQTLSWSDIKKINQNLRYEIGGHTTNHEVLSMLNKEELKVEIDGCLNQLEKKLKQKIYLFSYPEGKFNSFVIKQLKKRKIRICPTASPGNNNKNTDAFFLKRYMPGFMQQKFPFSI